MLMEFIQPMFSGDDGGLPNVEEVALQLSVSGGSGIRVGLRFGFGVCGVVIAVLTWFIGEASAGAGFGFAFGFGFGIRTFGFGFGFRTFGFGCAFDFGIPTSSFGIGGPGEGGWGVANARPCAN
jgi:hypothetical protein